MKYIRTKDELGIEREDGTCCFRTWAAYSNSLLKKDWLYADSIEELCDEFVAKGVPNKTFVIDVRDYKPQGLALKDYIGFLFAQYSNVEIYGAIWTDKGLIYVAKMNDKGELELL